MTQSFFVFLTLLKPVDLSIKFDTVKSDWSIVYIEGLPKILYVFLVLANSANSDVMPPFATFHLDLHCLSFEMVNNWSKGAVHFADTNNWSKISRDTNKDMALQSSWDSRFKFRKHRIR